MIEFMIGGKIAPIPSLFSKCSIIHCSQAFSAFSREGDQRLRSINLSVKSVVLNTVRQKPRRADIFTDSSRSSSPMLALSGIAQYGLLAHITASGTTIPLVQADISYKLIGAHV